MTVEVQAPTEGGTDSGRPRDDVQPVANETRDRIITGTVTIVPILGLGLVGWQLWSSWLHVSDLIVLFICYLLTGFGITVGFHRLFTHRAFKTSTAIRAILAVLGSMAIEGPVISWVADHRKHHVFSDVEGDPHSPHVDFGHGLKGALAGLSHAHVGWLFVHTQRGLKTRYAPDLLKDPVVRFIDRTFIVWAISGFILPFLLGWLIGGSLMTGLSGMLWGGLSACCSCTTRPSASTRSATSSAAVRTTPRTSRATCSGCRYRRWASRGTTTTTRSPRPPSTA